ncbi:hypothetical protein [Limobrevibacterium gyesilva]|uniref:Sulfotransferase family protein n=1 Tax=Limobrevibacterium gyesilva TaxID=2991712 RepID=A0AA41YWA4_9PROT|nr:hypothetical protein [Limobrevibacterium gyesilva]MCW3476547.1 hypothetical protein [Limobrevibacterium gyesilva]
MAALTIKASGAGYMFRFGAQRPMVDTPAAELYRPGAANERPARKRFRTCILHIGTEKTGTTTLQTFFSANREIFQRSGWFIPQTLAPHAAQNVLNHIHLATLAMDDLNFHDEMRRAVGVHDAATLRTYRRDLFQRLEAEIAAIPAECDRIILSNEHCHSRLTGPHEISHLKAFLDLFCDEYQVIAYLRPQHELAMSQYGMIVLNGRSNIDMFPPFPPPPGYAKRVYTNRDYFDYRKLLDNWARVFGAAAMQPRVFERRQLIKGNIIDDFLSGFTLAEGKLVYPQARNTNVSAAAQKFLIGFYEALGDEPRPGTDVVREGVRNALQERFPGSGILPARGDAEAFLGRFAESNEAVRARWFPGQPSLFSADFSRYPEIPDSDALSESDLYSIFIEVFFTYPNYLRNRMQADAKRTIPASAADAAAT